MNIINITQGKEEAIKKIADIVERWLKEEEIRRIRELCFEAQQRRYQQNHPFAQFSLSFSFEKPENLGERMAYPEL